ncbi:MAG: hypothetical protein HY216_01495 [Candidatus Rokubacteria bacterium]|nr:hypothetical protein [Candidatus Rokubacteria bacterium]
MKVVPLAADSLGVRSMATYVEVAGVGILIDPGATLAPTRFNLPPAEEEWQAFRRANDRILSYGARAQFVFVSHYHEDHFHTNPATYAGRTVLLKDPRRMIQGQQARRAAELWKSLTAVAKPTSADGAIHTEAGLSLEVSPPLGHGLEATPLGWVLALTIVDAAERERFVFASDVQGPLSSVATAYLVRQRPTLLYLSGPPLYMEHKIGADVIDRGIANLRRIIDATGCRVVMDHHAVRDMRTEARFAPLWETGRVQTVAGFLGLPDAMLERQRATLWGRARKPAARAGAAPEAPAGRRARMPWKPKRYAKGGTPE